MKSTRYIIGLTIILAAAMQSSCQREELPDSVPTPVGNVHGEEVIVKLSLDIDKEDAGTPEAREYVSRIDTKSVDDPAGADTTKIKDFWLFQFNGTADSCKLIGSAQHFDYAQFVSPDNPDANTAKLVSSSQPDAVFILANTCDPTMIFPYGMTIAELKSRVKDIKSQADLFGKGDPTGSGSAFPEDRIYHIMLNSQVNKTISAGTVLDFGLKRNVARVKVVINNTTATTDPDNEVVIDSLSLHNVPNTSNYITNTIEPQPSYIPANGSIQTFNYPKEAYKDGGIVFYVPVNKRGTKDNTTQNSKGMVAPPSSTFLRVDARYKSGDDWVPVAYTFYLGADLISDYNLLANSAYTYTITMSKKGDENFDYRVEDWGPVDFTKNTVERANCYILNPAPTYNRQFKIPIDRIRTFWGGVPKSDTDTTILYEKYDSTTTPASFMNHGFSAYILWTDIEDIANQVTIEMTNKGENSYFTATVKPDTEGNVVVAVQKNDVGDEILWSWHLWITDYRPDELHRYSPEDGRYIYEVTGGAVHRYAGDIWKTGIYKDKFIMDRNLGALDTTYVGSGKGSVYYQFGRKDPLPGPKAIYYPKSDLPQSMQWKPIGKSDAGAAFVDSTAVRYSVRYPLAFIKSGAAGWTYGNKYNPSSGNSAIRWQDPNVQSDEGKSLFDPCPPGYKVPKNGTWSNFTSYHATDRPKPTTNILGGDNPPRNLPKWSSTDRGHKNQTGLHYYPGTGDVQNTIFYPASGLLLYGSGAFANVGGDGNYWSCSPRDASNAYYLTFNSGGMIPSNDYSRANGFPVRCVQE